VGFYFPAGIGTGIDARRAFGFRWIERRMPIEFYANLTVAFLRNACPSRVARHGGTAGFVVANMNYSVTGDGKTFEYQMVIHSPDRSNTRPLSEALNACLRSPRSALPRPAIRQSVKTNYSSYVSALPASAVSISFRDSRGENSSMKVYA